MNKQINKRNTTNTGLLGLFEKLIRFIPHIYLVIRPIVKFTNYFEEDFYYLKKIFKNTRINIIDIGASDGISAIFFINNLNPKKIFCFEPSKAFFKKLKKLKLKYHFLKIYNSGLGKKNKNEIIYYPYINFFGKKIPLLAYSFPIKKDLINQINLDFIIKPKILKTKIKIKKFKIPKEKIHLIKIDTNGSELDIVNSIIKLIKRDKPVLIIENNNINKIYKILKKFSYNKYFVKNNNLKKHSNQNNANIIFKK